VLVLALARGAEAFHYVTPPLLQITAASGAGAVASPRWAGLRYVVFDTDADLLGTGSVGRQVFLFDLMERDLQGSQALCQITSGAGGSAHGSSGKRGQTIVYDTRPGGAGPRQIWLFERRTGARYALTAGTADSVNPTMDDASRAVVFESSADFFSTGTPGVQVYRIDLRSLDPSCPYPCATTANLGLTQITNKAGTSGKAVVSTGGKTVAFESDADLLGTGESETQVYAFDSKTGLTTALSQGPGASRNPTLNRSGGFVAFESDADLAGTGSGGTQIFLYRRSSGTLQQVTAAPGGSSRKPSLSSNGHALAFVSTDDLLGTGAVGPEIYSHDLRKATLSRITAAPASTSEPAYSAGVFATFLANGDLLGNGTSGTALYLVNLYAVGSATVP